MEPWTRESGLCLRCPQKRAGHWLCQRCTDFANSLVGKVVRVLPGADAALDEICADAYCERLCGPQEGQLATVAAVHLSNGMAPFVSYEGGGAPLDFVGPTDVPASDAPLGRLLELVTDMIGTFSFEELQRLHQPIMQAIDATLDLRRSGDHG